MKNPLTLMVCAIVLLQSWTSSSFGQENRDRGRPPFRKEDGAKWFELARKHGTYLELLPLLSNDSVRLELGIGEEKVSQLDAFREEMGKQLEQFRRKHRDSHQSRQKDQSEEHKAKEEEIRAEERKALEQANSKAEKLLNSLLPPEKFSRLLGLFAQLHGVSAVRNELIAKRIGITDPEELQKLREKIEQRQHDLMVESRGKFEEIFRSGYDTSWFATVLQEFKRSLDRNVSELLTAEQKSRFNELKGSDFAFPDHFLGRGFAPPGRGRIGAAGPPGRGPRSEKDRPPAKSDPNAVPQSSASSPSPLKNANDEKPKS